MTESSAGVVPLKGKDNITRPEKATGLFAAMSNSASLLIKLHAVESIAKVQVPLAAMMLLIGKDMDVGVGV